MYGQSTEGQFSVATIIGETSTADGSSQPSHWQNLYSQAVPMATENELTQKLCIAECKPVQFLSWAVWQTICIHGNDVCILRWLSCLLPRGYMLQGHDLKEGLSTDHFLTSVENRACTGTFLTMFTDMICTDLHVAHTYLSKIWCWRSGVHTKNF